MTFAIVKESNELGEGPPRGSDREEIRAFKRVLSLYAKMKQIKRELRQ